MWFLGGKRPHISPDDEEWQLATWQWFDELWGSVTNADHPGLILPTRTIFPDTDAKGHARAERYFHITRELIGMSDWPCELRPHKPPLDLGGSVALASMEQKSALGTFQRSGNAAIITYDPSKTDDVVGLVATFAHELCHYLLSAAPSDPPGGPENEEFATDLATVHAGFGLFGANSAFKFKQYSDFDRHGWSSQRSGYLTEHEWCFGIAIVAELRAIPEASYRDYLKDHLTSSVARSRRYLSANAGLLTALARAPSKPAQHSG